MPLSNSRLRQILTEIRPTQNQREFFQSKWLKIVHFLYNNTGYSISKVGKGGSQGKQTETYQSDFDLIFSCSDTYNRQERFNDLDQKLRENFSGATTIIERKTRAIYLKFTNDSSFDVVLVKSKSFNSELRRLREFRQSDEDMLNTIRLCKYSCSQVRNCNLESYEIEIIVDNLYNPQRRLVDNINSTLESISSTKNISLDSLIQILQ